jgi:hypothetical protein
MMVRVDAIKSSGQGNGYIAKYIGKDFGNRADQLEHRMRDLARVGADMRAEGKDPDEIPAALVDVRLELEAHRSIAKKYPRAVLRRWGASCDLERGPVQVIGADEPRLLKLLHAEVNRMDGVRWGQRSDHGIACYFDLSDISPDACPMLCKFLHDAAPARKEARAAHTFA